MIMEQIIMLLWRYNNGLSGQVLRAAFCFKLLRVFVSILKAEIQLKPYFFDKTLLIAIRWSLFAFGGPVFVLQMIKV